MGTELLPASSESVRGRAPPNLRASSTHHPLESHAHPAPQCQLLVSGRGRAPPLPPTNPKAQLSPAMRQPRALSALTRTHSLFHPRCRVGRHGFACRTGRGVPSTKLSRSNPEFDRQLLSHMKFQCTAHHMPPQERPCTKRCRTMGSLLFRLHSQLQFTSRRECTNRAHQNQAAPPQVVSPPLYLSQGPSQVGFQQPEVQSVIHGTTVYQQPQQRP